MTGSTGPNLEALKALAAKNVHEKWKGPYTPSDIPLDPWGRPYQYEYPTDKTSDGRPAIWSFGPDGPSANNDDTNYIRNYKPEETKMLKEQQQKIQQERMQNMQNQYPTGTTGDLMNGGMGTDTTGGGMGPGGMGPGGMGTGGMAPGGMGTGGMGGR